MTATSPLERILIVDSVRGVAVMGILLMNIVAFAMPEAAYINPRVYGGASGADLWVYLVNFVLFDGKMRGLFSFLFGASILLVADGAEASGRSAARVHYSRMVWLLLFGLAHLWLVWWGDILTLYAPVGMIAFLFRHKSVERLLAMGIVLVLAQSLLLAIMPIAYHYLQAAAAAPDAGREIVEGLRAFDEGFTPSPAHIAHELALYRGDYASILADRFREHALTPVRSLFLFGLETLGYMLFGMAALRGGLLRGEWTQARYAAWAAAGLAIGVAAYAALAAYLLHADFSTFSVALAVVTLPTPIRPIMILGWMCAIVLLARGGGALAQRFAAAGRMAFTNYLATSLICTTVFYGYGLGWFGHLTRWQLYPVVAAIWLLILLWSKPWLDRFAYGPLEWLWRSLARGRLQPMRRRI